MSEHVIFGVRQCLARSNNDAFSGMNTHGVDVFHVADRHAIIETVAHNLVFNFFPATQIFFDQDLWTMRQRFGSPIVNVLIIPADTRSEPTESVCRAEHNRIADALSYTDSFFD